MIAGAFVIDDLFDALNATDAILDIRLAVLELFFEPFELFKLFKFLVLRKS